MTLAEVSRVSKNTAEQRKASQKEKKRRFCQCCCVHLREKRENPRRHSLLLRYEFPNTHRKTVLENTMVTNSGERDLRNRRKRSERRGRRGGERLAFFFSSGVNSERASKKESAADMRSCHVPVLIRQAAATYSAFLPPL